MLEPDAVQNKSLFGSFSGWFGFPEMSQVLAAIVPRIRLAGKQVMIYLDDLPNDDDGSGGGDGDASFVSQKILLSLFGA